MDSTLIRGGGNRRSTLNTLETNRQQGSGPGQGVRWLAKGLGLFSLGLGLAAIAAPQTLGQLIGLGDRDTTRASLRSVGLREIVSGIGILARPRPAGWVRSRVAGDAMDLALMGRSLGAKHTDRNRALVTTAALAGIAAVDLVTSQRLERQSKAKAGQENGIHVTKAITVNRSPEEVYGFWHDFENLPRFMDHLDSVKVTGERRSHWKAKAPAGRKVEWDAEIVNDLPNRLIAWRSLKGADVDNSGSVRFRQAPGGRGTEVTVELRYNPPAGKLGQIVARIFGEEPSQQVEGDLRRFKQVQETGEVIVSDATLKSTSFPQPPAQPPRDDGKSKSGTADSLF